MTLLEAGDHVGGRVQYSPGGTSPEYGTVVFVNAVYVFVRFDGDRTAKAVSPALLTLAPNREKETT